MRVWTARAGGDPLEPQLLPRLAGPARILARWANGAKIKEFELISQ